MDIFLTQEDVGSILHAADLIYATISRAQGRADSYAAKREEFKLLQFPTTEHQPPAKMDILEFTKKEISKMPKFFKETYKLKGGTAAHIRRKPNGTYEIRYRRDGLNISVSAKNLADAKERFITALCHAKADSMNGDSFFEEYAIQWMTVVKKPQIKENTWNNYLWTLKTYVLPKFGKMRMRDIKPIDVQKLLNHLSEKGIQRGAENVYIILKPIFDFAVAEDVITKSPMTLIRKPKYEKKQGIPLSTQEESEFVKACLTSGSICRYAYILMLYTGIRRAELPTAVISEKWITVISAKTRKGEAQKTRKIPVSPMLRPFLPLMTKENLTVSPQTLTHGISKIIEGHHLHELRHTFITRCQECGISRELTSIWAGHKADNTMTTNVYTHFSEEFQLSEIEKLKY